MVDLGYAPVAQMDRVHASGAWGREFESHRARHFHENPRRAQSPSTPSLRLMNEALKKVEAKYMVREKKGRRLSSLLFRLLYDGTAPHALVEGTHEPAGLPIGLRRASADSKAGCRFLQLGPLRG